MHSHNSQDAGRRRRIPAVVAENHLFYGDNLDVLANYASDESVDLVYLDPPFKSNQDYNILFAEQDGSRAAAQIRAFEDTWRWDQGSARAYEQIVERGGPPAAALRGFRTLLGENDVLAYLAMMAPRLVELHRVLKRTGSIYLHCDPTAGHYLKVLMDAVFDPKNFRNEIVWRRTGAHGKSRRFAPIHQTLFFYARSGDYKWKKPRKPYMRGHVEQYLVQDERGWRTNYYGNVLTGSGVRNGESGQPWRGIDPTAKGRHWAIPGVLVEDVDEDLSGMSQHQKLDRLFELGYIKIDPDQAWPIYEHYLDPADGQAIGDIWAFQPYSGGTVFGTEDGIDEDVRWLSPRDQERLGYPTQKPEGLLERIISATTDEGDVVLDPFCGCGTALAVAERLNRRWIGIDVTHLAISLIRHRLERYMPGAKYQVVGEPVSLPDAEALAESDRYQFQWWAVGRLGAYAMDYKKGADRGIDGRLYFHDPPGGETKQLILSVKSGQVGVRDMRDLRGVVVREGAEGGVLLTLRPPSDAMRREAASAGFYHSAADAHFPTLQILTIEELLAEKSLDYPPASPDRARPEQLVLAEAERGAAKPKETSAQRSKRPQSVPDLVTELLAQAGIRRPPVRLEPILEQLNMELSARPGMREDAMLVSMSHPDQPGPPSAWMVYYNPSKPEARRRFTIAHEVGHALLHGEPLAAAARGGGGRKKREREVERFAAELLMPRHFIVQAAHEHGPDPEVLRALFQVSRQAMEIRLRELGLG